MGGWRGPALATPSSALLEPQEDAVTLARAEPADLRGGLRPALRPATRPVLEQHDSVAAAHPQPTVSGMRTSGVLDDKVCGGIDVPRVRSPATSHVVMLLCGQHGDVGVFL